MSTYIDQTFTNLKVLPFFSETNPDALEGFYVAGGEPPKTIWPEGLESARQQNILSGRGSSSITVQSGGQTSTQQANPQALETISQSNEEGALAIAPLSSQLPSGSLVSIRPISQRKFRMPPRIDYDRITRTNSAWTLSERLSGWNAMSYDRSNNARSDTYFYHKKSERRFRSFIAVVEFILYGTLPEERALGNKDDEPVEVTLEKAHQNLLHFFDHR